MDQNFKTIDNNMNLLGRKRTSNELNQNFHFRRLLTGDTTSGEYEVHASRVCNMFSLNWLDEEYIKPTHDLCNFYLNI
jgi:hypothetical protein